MFEKHRATFLLLPSSVALDHAYLGRFVTNVYAPGHSYAPEQPIVPDIRGYESIPPVIQHNARGLFKDKKYSSIRGQLSDLLKIDYSREGVNDLHWKTGVLTTRTLLNHGSYLQKALHDKDVGKSLQGFLQQAWNPEDKRQRKDVFLIVGVKEWTDAEVKASSDRSKGLKMGGKIPVGEAAQLPTDKLDLAGEVDYRKESDVTFAADYEGVTVFAVQYRRLKSVKAGGISLEEAKKLGPGVFGPDGSNAESKAKGLGSQDNELLIDLDADIDEDFLDDGEDDTEITRIQDGEDDILCVKKPGEKENIADQESGRP